MGVGTYILPKNDHQNNKTLGWAFWHLVFTVSTVVRNKVTKTVPEKQLVRTTHATRESNCTRELPPTPTPKNKTPKKKKKPNLL